MPHSTPPRTPPCGHAAKATISPSPNHEINKTPTFGSSPPDMTLRETSPRDNPDFTKHVKNSQIGFNPNNNNAIKAVTTSKIEISSIVPLGDEDRIFAVSISPNLSPIASLSASNGAKSPYYTFDGGLSLSPTEGPISDGEIRCIIKSPRCGILEDVERTVYELAHKQRLTNFPRLLHVTQKSYDVDYNGRQLTIPPTTLLIEEAASSVFDQIDRIADKPLYYKVDLAIAMADAVHDLHELGYIHRDLKLENFVLDRIIESNDAPVVKLIDFEFCVTIGTFGRYRNPHGEEVPFAGSPRYMSPECTDGHCEYTEKYDIYGLGLVFLTLFGGVVDVSEMHQQKINFLPKHAQLRYELNNREITHNEAVPSHLRDIVDWALKTHPEERPTVTEIIKKLKEFRSNIDTIVL